METPPRKLLDLDYTVIAKLLISWMHIPQLWGLSIEHVRKSVPLGSLAAIASTS